MDRKEFLSMLGISAAVITCGACFNACSSEDNSFEAPPTNVDFTLDLDDPAYNTLHNNGGYIYKNGIIVARTTTGTYIAVSQACTHQGTSVQYNLSANQFHCPNHGSNFALNGSVVNGPAGQALKQYHTTFSGHTLRVYS